MAGPITPMFLTLRRLTGSLVSALGIMLIAGLCVAAAATWLFDELVETVRAGGALALDTSVLTWMGAHQSPATTAIALEVTTLGTGIVVVMLTAVAALFLFLSRQRAASALLLVTTLGGVVLNSVLKHYFHRPRPHLFAWDTDAVSSSFPSGHAMNALIAYGTVAYLAARLQHRWWARATTMAIAVLVILAIAGSRVYLGVHYPSDVLGGVIIGTAWVAFCMAVLDTVQRLRPAPPARPQ